MNVTNKQKMKDADSSLKNSVDAIFGKEPQGVYKCGGHVGRVG